MVFKTGQDEGNMHLGFVANVYFKEKLWEYPPVTGFCAPLKKISMKDKSEYMSAEIIYNSKRKPAGVFCSYTSHVSN